VRRRAGFAPSPLRAGKAFRRRVPVIARLGEDGRIL